MNTAQSATEFRAKQCANPRDPLRDGSEKTKRFDGRARHGAGEWAERQTDACTHGQRTDRSAECVHDGL